MTGKEAGQYAADMYNTLREKAAVTEDAAVAIVVALISADRLG